MYHIKFKMKRSLPSLSMNLPIVSELSPFVIILPLNYRRSFVNEINRNN